MSKVLLFTYSLLLWSTKPVPLWFAKAFTAQKLDGKYFIIKTINPTYLEADFNGDKKDDVAIIVVEKKSQKKGILILSGRDSKFFLFGGGKKFKDEDFDNINWISGWRIYKDHLAYQTKFSLDGDIIGSKKVKLKYPAISIYTVEDGDQIAGQIIYWTGSNFESIHQGE